MGKISAHNTRIPSTIPSLSEMTYLVSGGALNSILTHSLTHSHLKTWKTESINFFAWITTKTWFRSEIFIDVNGELMQEEALTSFVRTFDRYRSFATHAHQFASQ